MIAADPASPDLLKGREYGASPRTPANISDKKTARNFI